MHFSQMMVLVLAFGLSFTVTAKPSWKNTDTTIEKPGTKKKEITSKSVTDTTSEPVKETISEPVADTTSLSWNIPVSRENGDLLMISELAGYKVIVLDVANNIEYFVMINDPTITEWDFTELTTGIWEFSIAAIDVQGAYSNYSTVASKTIY